MIYISKILSVPLPDELTDKMCRHTDIKWVEVARQALWAKVSALEKLDKLLSKSKLTEEDVMRHTGKLKKKVWGKHKQKLGL